MDMLATIVVVVSIYHAIHKIYVVNLAIRQAATLSSHDYWKGTDRTEYEKRRRDYIELHSKLCLHVSRWDDSMSTMKEILGTLTEIRASMFYDAPRLDPYFYTLWMMCLHSKKEMSGKDVCQQLSIIGLDIEESKETVRYSDILRMFCAQMMRTL
jgi:hypothetical protein